MAKKLFAQLALAIMISLIMMPIALAKLNPMGDTQYVSEDGKTAAEKYSSPPSPPAPKQSAAELLILGNPWNIQQNGKGDIAPCINELVPENESNPDYKKLKPGPDNGYVISIMEEPLNVQETKEKTSDPSKPNYVIRRCFRNTFQYMETVTKAGQIINYIPHSVIMLADKCSATAQKLMTEDKELGSLNQVKYSCKEVQVILTKGGSSAIYGYINMIYKWGASLVGIIAVTVITVSGIQISASGGDSEAISSAKKRIIQSIVGILVLFLSSLILYTINPTFFTM